jgi:hypothetical protein
MQPILAKGLMDRWDSLSLQQKQKEVLEMPAQCHVCGGHGDGMNFMPDAAVGYTGLICHNCTLEHFLQRSNDDDDDCETNDGDGGGDGGDDDYNHDDDGNNGDEDDDDGESIQITNFYTFSCGDNSSSAPAPFSGPNCEATSAVFGVGCRVLVTGLVAARQHNGQMGTVSIAIDESSGRLGVVLDNGAELKIKASNLTAISLAAPPADRAALDDPFAAWITAARARSMPVSGFPPILSRVFTLMLPIFSSFLLLTLSSSTFRPDRLL